MDALQEKETIYSTVIREGTRKVIQRLIPSQMMFGELTPLVCATSLTTRVGDSWVPP